MFRFLNLLVGLVGTVVILSGCHREKTPLDSWFGISEDSLIPINRDYVAQAQICTWKDDKAAAYTIAFDDARPSHFQISGPELTARGMVGTFNVHTKGVEKWKSWQALFDKGHEIASHTRSHTDLTQLSESDLRQELEVSKYEIESHIRGIEGVPSFTYPMGRFNDTVARIVADYYCSARGRQGINSSTISENDFFQLKGLGVYPPFDMESVNGRVEEAINAKGWILVYFHSVSDQELSDLGTIPLSKFRQHIDFVAGKKDSLWIATQGAVSQYIRLRQKSSLECHVVESKKIQVTLHSESGPCLQRSMLSVSLVLPPTWAQCQVVALRANAPMNYQKLEAGKIIFDIRPEEPVSILAVK